MSTEAQRNSHGRFGNEILYPLALSGNAGSAAAAAILADRGNEITPEGKLRKTRTTQYMDQRGQPHELIQVVENGKMVEESVDGVAITGNVLRF